MLPNTYYLYVKYTKNQHLWQFWASFSDYYNHFISRNGFQNSKIVSLTYVTIMIPQISWNRIRLFSVPSDAWKVWKVCGKWNKSLWYEIMLIYGNFFLNKKNYFLWGKNMTYKIYQVIIKASHRLFRLEPNDPALTNNFI